MTMDFASIPIISVLCYVVGCLFSLIFTKFSTAKKYIPIIVVLVGCGLGILMYYTTPQIISANNIWDAVAIGIISGASSTGVNQIFKQIVSKPIEETKESYYNSGFNDGINESNIMYDTSNDKTLNSTLTKEEDNNKE